MNCQDSHHLQVQVSDASPTRPTVQAAEPLDEHGRGLALIDILSAAWSVDPHPAGKTVWFLLTSTAQPRPA